MYKLLVISALSILCISCQGQQPKLEVEGANYFGDRIEAEGATTFTEVTWPQSNSDTLEVKLTGEIHEVCQAKGCWMTLQKSGMDETVFIKFKDYGFFVPKDADGKEAIVRGKLYASVTSVEELKHYAEDKGASAEELAAITEPQREIKMMADGVIIYN